MATLNINGRSVSVDDGFLSLSPDQQNAAVEEIARSLPAIQPSPAIKAGQQIPYAGQNDNAQSQSPNLLNSTLATINGITGSVPFLQPAADGLIATGQTIGDILANRPGTVSQHYADIQKQRQQVAQTAPIANTLGGLGGTIGLQGALGTIPAAADALGLTGSFGKQLLNSGLSMAGYGGLQGLSQGDTGAKLLTDEVGSGLGGVGGSVIGQGLRGLGEGLSSAAQRGAQNDLIDTAVSQSGGASSDLLKSNARDLFSSSVDNNPLQVTDSSYMSLLGDIQNSLQKMRPNELRNGPVVGTLQKMFDVADQLNTPGNNTAVDLKDLHIFRQDANEVAQMGGQNGLMGQTIVNNIDKYISGLTPDDIAGGADPTQSATNLLQAISDWGKAKKVDVLMNAVNKAQGYPSGYENGLKTTFNAIVRNPDQFSRFSPAEQAAIQQVAKGTTGQNIASAFGKLGINFNGTQGPSNILGGGLGTAGAAELLTPIFGPGARYLAPAITTPIGMVGRNIATDVADNSAKRAIQAVAVGNIQTAPLATPNIFNQLAQPSRLMIAPALGAGINAGVQGLLGP